jgi:hypothetical protein
MLALSGLDDSQYESSANKIIYGKLIGNIMEDFVSREDMKMIMKSSNLPVSTKVNTAVTGSLTPPTAVAGSGIGAGNGQVSPIYIGDTASPGSQLVKQKRIAEKEAGGIEVEAQTSGLEAIAGN